MNKQKKIICATAAAGCIATFLPWISVSAGAFGYSVNQSQNGFHGAGVLFFLLMAAIIAIAAIGGQTPALQKNIRLIFMGTGAFCLVLLLIAKSSQADGGGNFGGVVSSSISMGFGLILAFIASIGLIAVPLVIKEAGESFQNDLAVLKTSVQSVQENIAKIPKPAIGVNHNNSNQNNRPDRMAELEKLISWRNDGKISQEEFEDLKAKII